jgi:uncharacterized protein YjbJ (UPF0337 family)
MNWDTIKGKWSEVEGEIRSKWSKLTDDDIGLVRGKLSELAGRLQQRYGIARDQAEKHVDEFIQGIRRKRDDEPTQPNQSTH